MPQEVILLKLGEIALKGLNRKAFEDVLLKNIRRRLGKAGEFTVASRQSTIYVEPANGQADMDLAEERVRKVFGVVGYARAGIAEKDLKSIQELADKYGITLDTNDGQETLTLDMSKWTEQEDGIYAFNGGAEAGGLTLETNLTPVDASDQSSEAVQQQVFILQNTNS